MTDLHAQDPESWLATVWLALECHRENCIPEGLDPAWDEEWSDICAAMAWIREALGLPDEVVNDDAEGEGRAMNPYDAAKILGLSGEITPDQVKSAYRAACKKFHPDVNPAGEEMMKVVNAAFEALREFSGTIKEQQSDYGDLLNDALNAVLPLSGLVVEVCGAWVWVTGDTRTHKEALKTAGYKWASKKLAWYFRPEQFRSRSKGETTLEEIREKYGSHRPQGQGFARIGERSHV